MADSLWEKDVITRRIDMARQELIGRGVSQTDIDWLLASFDQPSDQIRKQQYSLLASMATVLRWTQTGSLSRPGYARKTREAAAEGARILLKVMHGDEP